jgi:hypothetical protein
VTERPDRGRTTVSSARRYRLLDRASKLLGVALVAAGLHVGGSTTPGIALAALGVATGLLTVFIETQ